ncbi:hypothetical protein HGB07_00730 [Candidatus Roizmanbacteria bacterium]|nr:hypothetical protein [Candidatus Roizmanbacteria bacterium]
MNKQLIIDCLAWGLGLWFVGYVLGIVFFMIVPKDLIGWAILPFGVGMTLWVLLKKIKSQSFSYYLVLAVIWALVAIVFDYFFLVMLIKPADGYYKLDVFVYYFLMFILPVGIGWKKSPNQSK